MSEVLNSVGNLRNLAGGPPGEPQSDIELTGKVLTVTQTIDRAMKADGETFKLTNYAEVRVFEQDFSSGFPVWRETLMPGQGSFNDEAIGYRMVNSVTVEPADTKAPGEEGKPGGEKPGGEKTGGASEAGLPPGQNPAEGSGEPQSGFSPLQLNLNGSAANPVYRPALNPLGRHTQVSHAVSSQFDEEFESRLPTADEGGFLGLPNCLKGVFHRKPRQVNVVTYETTPLRRLPNVSAGTLSGDSRSSDAGIPSNFDPASDTYRG